MLSRRNVLATLAAAPVFASRAAAIETDRLLVVTTNLRIPTSLAIIDPAKTGFKFRTLHIFGTQTTEISLGFCGWTIPKNVEVDVSEPHRYDKVAVEFGLTTVPVTFGGERGVTIAGGVAVIWSDPIPASAFGLSHFPRDGHLYVRAMGRAAPGATLPAGTVASAFGMRMSSFPVGTAIDDIDARGDMSAPRGATTRILAPGPTLIVGPVDDGSLAVACAGDSIADGVGDGARLTTGPGFFNRAALDEFGRGAIASLNLTKRGSTVGTTALGLGVPGAAGFAYRQAMLRHANVLVDQYGTNTLGSAKLVPAASAVDPSRQLWALARASGIQRIMRTSLLPRTTSSNGFTDMAGQRPATNWSAGSTRDVVNATFAAALARGEIDALVDLLPTVADPADDSRWFSNTIAGHVTVDGLHPSSAMARLMAVPLRHAYAGLELG